MFLIKHFVASTIHLGHKTNQWNPRTSYFLLGIRDGIFVIDLEQTLIMLRKALAFIKKICLKRGYIFYVPSQESYLENERNFFISKKKLKINEQTDFNLIFLSPEYFSSSKQRGMLYAFTQKRKNLPRLFADAGDSVSENTNFNSFSFSNLFLRPEALFILQTRPNSALIKEAVKLQIPIVGILDSNSNPYAIQYPIPGNDDSNEAFNLYTELLINTISDAKKTEAKSFFF